MFRTIATLGLSFILFATVPAAQAAEPLASPTPTPAVTATPAPSATPKPTTTPPPAGGPSVTPTPSPSASPTPEVTPSPTPKATPDPTPRPTGGPFNLQAAAKGIGQDMYGLVIAVVIILVGSVGVLGSIIHYREHA